MIPLVDESASHAANHAAHQIQPHRADAGSALQPYVSQLLTDLRPLVASFDKAPLENGRKMRELLNGERAAFPLAAARLFGEIPDERGCRYLITILWTQDLLIPLLAGAAVPHPLAVAMAQAAARVDSQFHFRLSTYLHRGFEKEGAPMEEASRLLAILSSTMDAASLVPLLQKILAHPNSRVRSKATLLIGRVHSAVAALEKLLTDKDPRVRANAIEALWSNPDPRTETLFLNALTDANPRVAGNAVVGLYLAGSTKAIPAALAFIKNANAGLRMTGVWAMGKTGDPRFLPYLGKLLGESTGQLRKVVFYSLQASQRCASARTQPAPVVHLLSMYRHSGRAHLHVGVTDAENREPVALPPTAFFLGAGPEPVVEFACTPHRGERTHVSFVLPGCPSAASVLPSVQLVLTELLARKPEAEQWAVRYYDAEPAGSVSDGGGAASGAAGRIAARFTKDPVALAAQIAPPGGSQKTLGGLGPVLREQIDAARQGADRLHVVALVDATCGSAAETAQALLTEASVGNLAFHFLVYGPDQPIETAEAAGKQLECSYDSLTCYYALAFDASILDAHRAEPLHIQVHTSASVGKLQVPPEWHSGG